MGASRYIHLEDVSVVKETEKAFLLRLDDDTEHWIPKNQIADWEDLEEGETGRTVSITEWIAGQKGIA